jgi:diguanylate cyclase (GGDEF)-like protein
MSFLLLMFGSAAGLVLGLLACNVIGRTMPGLVGIREISWALAAGTATVLLFALRPWIPSFLTILLANFLLFASLLLVYRATAMVGKQRGSFLPWGVGICAATLPAFIYYTYFHVALVPRILISSGVLDMIAIATSISLFRYRSQHAVYSARVLGCLQIADALLHVVRCIFTVIYPPSDMVHLDPVQTGYSYLHLIFCIATGCGVLWLSICEQRRELQRMARTDSLTGLLNRRSFDEILQRDLQRCRRAGNTTGLILVDLDYFKAINDTHGHAAGDEVIRRVADVLERGTRPIDALARYGGEEFIILLRDSALEDALGIAERLRKEIESLPAPKAGLKITASLGVAISRLDETMAELIDRCDQALYESKRAGRNLVTLGTCKADHPKLALSF